MSNFNNCIDVSVVIGVYNAENVIADTLQSVLTQTGPLFELIVVDDGSTDNTASIIESVLSGQPSTTFLQNKRNQGLTRSLIWACELAKGKYIARIDAGDIYLPGRLAAQSKILDTQEAVGLVSCGTRFISENGEFLYSVQQTSEQLTKGLETLNPKQIRGPSHHGSVMFRSKVYEAVGGYRPDFSVAQDLDLWMRISEKSDVVAVRDIYYESTLQPSSISFRNRNRQLETTKIIVEGAKCRRSGLREPDYRRINSKNLANNSRNSRLACSKYNYFVGACLTSSNAERASDYLRLAWLNSPANLKYAVRYLWTRLAR